MERPILLVMLDNETRWRWTLMGMADRGAIGSTTSFGSRDGAAADGVAFAEDLGLDPIVRLDGTGEAVGPAVLVREGRADGAPDELMAETA